MSTPVTIINLDRVATLLVQARKEVYRVSDVAIKVDNDPGSNRGDVARLGRDLLHLSEMLQLSAHLINNEYWVLKGYPDMLEDE